MSSTMKTQDGLDLMVMHWPAEITPSRGTVLVVHGLGEHCMRYAHVAKSLNSAGWDVMAYDHRGHGQSGGARGDIPSPNALLDDLALMVDAARAAAPAKLVLLGHSMGGAIASRFLLDAGPWSRPVDGLILSSPALAADLNPIQKLLLAVAPRLMPHTPVDNGVKLTFVTRDRRVVQAYAADPLVHRKLSPMLARFIIDAGELARSRASSLSVPTLLLFAGQDRLVAPRGSRAFAAAAPPAQLTYICFDAMYHEIFNDPEKGQVFAKMLDWLAKKV
jgi:alpha-beta hydrolase superfamily lysophospholipase